MANIGFATISVIPSFKGIDVRARAGMAVLTKIGKDVGDDTGKKFSQGFESKVNPDLKNAGQKAGKGFVDGVEGVGPPDLSKHGANAGDGFVKGLGDKVRTGAKAGLAAAGVAAAAILGQAFLKGMENEVATDKLAAQLGGSDWAKGLGKVAGNLYLQGFGESVADTAATVRAVVQNGLLSEDATNDQIEALSTKVLTFTDVLGQDLPPTIRAVATLLRTGLAGSASEALDLLTRGIQQGADIGEDLLDTLNEYPTLFRDLGLDGKKGLGLIIQGLKGGARNSDIVADALKEFGIRSKDASVLSLDSFKKIGLNGEKMTRIFAKGGPEAAAGLQTVLDKLRGVEDPVARSAAAVGLFGTQAEDLGAALFELDPATAVAGLGYVAGATDNLSSAYDNASSRIEAFKREALEKVTLFIGNEVIPRLQDFAHWAEENDGSVRVLAGGVAFLGTMLFFAATPLLASAALLLALGAAAIYAYEQFPWFRNAIDNIVQGLETMYGLLEDVGRITKEVFGFFGFGSETGVQKKYREALEKARKAPIHGALGNIAERAGGGSVWSHTPYIVGEKGPELFVPGASGTVIPNHNLSMTPLPGGAGDGAGLELSVAPGAERDAMGWILKYVRVNPAAKRQLAA